MNTRDSESLLIRCFSSFCIGAVLLLNVSTVTFYLVLLDILKGFLFSPLVDDGLHGVSWFIFADYFDICGLFLLCRSHV